MNKFFAIAILLLSFVFVTSCSDEPEMNGWSNTEQSQQPQPDEKKVVKVEGTGCSFTNAEWFAKNAELKNVTRSRSVDMNREDAFAGIKTTKTLNAIVTWSDGSVTDETRSYTETDHIGFYGLNDKRFVSDIKLFNEKPNVTTEEVVDGIVYLHDFSGFQFAVKVNREKSNNSFMIQGTEISTCSNEVNYRYINAAVADCGRDSISGNKRYHLYRVNFTAHVAIDNGGDDLERDVIVASANVWDTNDYKEPTPDPELVDYIFDGGIDAINATSAKSYGELYALYSDGSKKKVADKSVILYNAAFAPANQVVNVADFYWNLVETANATSANGETRMDGEFSVKGYTTSQTVNTNYFSCVFTGKFEKATFVAPNGKEIEMPSASYAFDNSKAVDGAVNNGDGYDFVNVTVSTEAYFLGNAENLNSNVELRVKKETPADPIQTGIRIENEHVDGAYIVFDLVREFDSKADEKATLSFRHNASMSVENMLSTSRREYGVKSSEVSEISTSAFQTSAGEGMINGDNKHMRNIFSYADFTNAITYSFPANLVYSENGFSAPLELTAAAVEKTGSETSVNPVSVTETEKIFDDSIYYRLIFCGNEVANGTQVVRYIETVETPDEPEVPNVDPTYVGYHVVASKSGAALVINADWQLFVSELIAFEKDDNTETFYVVNVYESDKNGNYGNKVYSNKCVCALAEYPCATYTNDGEWAPAYLVAAEGSITDKPVKGWYQMPLTSNGVKVKVSQTIASTLQIQTPLLDAGSWNAETKVYTLNGVSYK